MEQAREGIALTVLRAGRHSAIAAVALLIAGLGALPPYHRTALWRDKRGGAIRQHKGSALFLDNSTFGVIVLLTRDMIAEGHIVVADRELHGHLLALGILEVNGEHLSHIVHLRLLHLTHLVGTVHLTRLGINNFQALGEVAKIRTKAQGRRQQHLLSVEGDGIGSLRSLVANLQRQFSIWRCDADFASASLYWHKQGQHKRE